jgi:hypothetical protein
MDNTKLLLKKLNKIEKSLLGCRQATSLTDGFGTMRLAKKQRKTEELVKEKYKVIEELTNELGFDFFCDGHCQWCNGSQNCKYPYIG